MSRVRGEAVVYTPCVGEAVSLTGCGERVVSGAGLLPLDRLGREMLYVGGVEITLSLEGPFAF